MIGQVAQVQGKPAWHGLGPDILGTPPTRPLAAAAGSLARSLARTTYPRGVDTLKQHFLVFLGCSFLSCNFYVSVLTLTAAVEYIITR